MSDDHQAFDREMKRTVDNFINSNYVYNNLLPQCDMSRKSSLSTTSSNFMPLGMPVTFGTEKGYFENNSTRNLNFQCGNLNQNSNLLQNLQNRMAYENLVNFFRSQIATSTNNIPLQNNFNFGNSNFMFNPNFNFSGVPPCPYVNNMYNEYACQANNFIKMSNFSQLVKTNTNSESGHQIKDNNINNIIGTIKSKNENIIKSEEISDENFILHGKRRRETTSKNVDEESEEPSNYIKNSRKVTKCPHTDQKHYAKVKLILKF
jgi:hypothetical protein